MRNLPVIFVDLNDVDGLNAIKDSTTAVFVEPIQGEGGITACSKEFLTKLREKCTKHDVTLVFDEIQCGLSRTGKLFAYENFGVCPDIITLAKPLSNGFPVGAVIVSDAISKSLVIGDHGTTFGGSPFASRLGLATLSRISQPSFLAHVLEMGKLFTSELKKVQLTYPNIIKDVRGMGLMLGIQLGDSYTTELFITLSRNKGLLVVGAGKNVIRIVPPLIISSDEIKQSIHIIVQVMSEMKIAAK